MNDRFAAQLRQHLVDTANERPAEGALAAIAAGVAVTRQRRPLAARLPWTPSRSDAYLWPALRFAVVALALVLAVVAGAIIGAGNASRSTVFEGAWTSIDPGDGSVQLLYVGAGTTPTVRYEDRYASGAACMDDPVKVFIADGSGTVDGDVLHAVFPRGGGCGLQSVDVGPDDYTYDEERDSTVDAVGVTWERVADDAVVFPSLPLITDASPLPTLEPPTPEPPAEPECIKVQAGDTYTGDAGGLMLTATLPTDVIGPWEGSVGDFSLGIGCGTSLIGINALTQGDQPAETCVATGPTSISTFAEAVEILSTPKGDDIAGPINMTIDGYDAVRFDVSALATCPIFGLWGGALLGAGESGSIYAVDVDGVVLTSEVNWTGGASPPQIRQGQAIVESLQITPLAVSPPSPGAT